jgi:hypothetical protein
MSVYASDPYDTDQPPCLCGGGTPETGITTPEFCPACGDPDAPGREPTQGSIRREDFAHDDDYAQAMDEARWDCRQPNPCCCPDCQEAEARQ